MRHQSPTRSLLAAIPILAVLAAFLTIPPSAEAARSIHPALTQPIDPALPMHQRFLSRDSSGRALVNLFVEGTVSPAALRSQGIEVGTVSGTHMTARCPLGQLQALLSMPGVERVEVAERCEPYLDQSVIDVGLPSVRTVPPPDFTGQTGAGILIGDVDTGIDLAHPDFKNPDGTTRLVSVWDQTVNGTPPAGFSYGTEWSQAQINAGQATETDTEGHGTHVMGIAGGDGSATGNGVAAFTYVGVAPKADLCMVKTDFATSSIVDAVSYIFQKAAALGKKAVVNLSLGSEEGPHDGTGNFDVMVSALAGPGKIVTASAGNAEQDDIHGQVTVSGVPQTMTLNIPTYTKNAGPANDYLLFSGWYEGADQISLTIITPGNTTIGPIATGGMSTGNNTVDGYVNAFNGTSTPSNGDHEMYVEIYDNSVNRPPKSGTWQFIFTPVAIFSTGRVDTWNYANHIGDGSARARWVQGLAVGGVIGTPGSADSVITAGAHTTKDCWMSIDGGSYCWSPKPTLGAIAPFSSWGPLRDGRIKPDLSGPGFGVAAAKSANSSVTQALVVPDGQHFLQAGTSMSSPHVAGAVALLLAQPEWANAGPTAIKQRLRSTARADGFTGTLPNATWGSGKLDIAAALVPPAALQIIHPSKGQYIPPGKPDSVTVLLTGGSTADSVRIDLSTNGGATYPFHLGTLTSVNPGAPRSLSYFVDVSMMSSQAKVRGTAYLPSPTVTGYSDSLFLIMAPTAVEVVASAAAPRFSLGPNTPNPFNPITTIAFGTERPGRVSLRIFSAKGQLVRTLVDRELPAGSYRARWDGRGDRGTTLGSGVYIYQLSAGGKNVSRKMSLLK